MIIIDSEYDSINQNRIIELIDFILKFYNLIDKEISVSIVNDNEIRELNNKYRNINESTDVLSFPLIEGKDIEDDETMLGDIVISIDTAIKQSEELKHPLFIEIDNLIIHSMLHLLGYDHIEPNDKTIMFDEHKKIIAKFLTFKNNIEYIEDNWLLN